MALITVHRLTKDARRVTARVGGVVHDLGRVYNDNDLTEALRRAGVEEPADVWDDPDIVTWEGEEAHVWGSGLPRPPVT
ncbi:hypothetical protein SMD44_p10013 (plasmid) [Streptomyces alboflavus]|uniref:Uncharacterized protein n=1 Tax=Streptomyces alboflavus TaxID=67267 RepID=A0A291W4N5_9ACTN|nr:hypothetical protein [Streptomyces alboflavus]ATM24512.1 hypothetical protein SMD44_p10013 [Streptomyces alboflavus]